MTDPVVTEVFDPDSPGHIRWVGSAEMDQAIDPDVPIQYHHFPGSYVVVCLIMLRNGQPVTGECSNLCKHTFNLEVAKEFALNTARGNMWPILCSQEPGYFNIKRT